MDLYTATERGMGMSDDVWARHANPWSGWTRLPILPLLVLAIYARAWVGWWCLLPVVLLLAWTWINPRAFPPPRDYDNWMSLAVLGERWFLARRSTDLPAHHRRAAGLLTGLSLFGLAPLVFGLLVLSPVWTVLGTVLVVVPKLVFLDRCVWIFQDMTGHSPGDGLESPKLPSTGSLP